jgi:hypothetical protein
MHKGKRGVGTRGREDEEEGTCVASISELLCPSPYSSADLSPRVIVYFVWIITIN